MLHGPSTAGGAYMPGLSDYVIGVKGNGMAALAGAALVRAATGEVADDARSGRRRNARHAYPVWSNTWPRTMPTASRSRAR